MSPSEYRSKLTSTVVERLRESSSIKAVWEGGSAATGYTDEFSDLDLNILASGDADRVFDIIEDCLNEFAGIKHKWAESKSFWPDLTQKVYFLNDSPKHFFVDVAMFPDTAEAILKEFMQVERHGTPNIHFDNSGKIRPHPFDTESIQQKQRDRFRQISAATPIFVTEVHKELDRGNGIDAIAFYQMAIVRPLVELLGIIHRPHQFDFGLRYLRRSFPQELADTIENLLYVESPAALRKKMEIAETLFEETLSELKTRFT